MHKSIVIILALFVLALSGLGIFWVGKNIDCSSLSNSSGNQIGDDTLQLISSIRNEDIAWSGTFIGLVPELTGASLALQDSREDIDPLLVKLLLNRDKYVAAHVLLTMRSSESFTESTGKWNGMKVELFSNGEVSYEGNNLVWLWIYWIQKLHC